MTMEPRAPLSVFRGRALGAFASLCLPSACVDDLPSDATEATSSTGGAASSSSGGPPLPVTDSSGGDTTASATTTGATTTGATTTGATTTGSSTTAGPEDTSTGSTTGADSGSSSSGEGVIMCDDGIVVAGEFCFVDLAIAGVFGNRGLEVLDVDDDGDLDIVTGTSVVRANGDGTYAVTSPMPGGPFIAAGQLDADALAEVAIPQDTTLELHHLDAAGGVSAVDVYAFAGDFGYAAKVGDLLGSPEPDVAVVALFDGALQVFINDAGVLSPQLPIYVGSGSRHVEIADLDGDGLSDLIVAEEGAQVSLLLNDGLGFGPASSRATSGLYTTLSVADVDLDGVPDLIGASPTGGFAEILYGDGVGGIGSDQLVPVPVDPRAIGIGDFDSDGIPDLVAPSYESGTDLAIVLGEGGGSFAAPFTVAFPAWAHDVEIADLNEDGVDDVAIYGDSVALLLSTP